MRDHARWLVIKSYLGGSTTALRVAKSLGLSVRQVRRLVKRARSEGVRCVIHRNRGRASNRRLKKNLVTKISGLYRDTYDGFNLTHFRDMLIRREKMQHPPCRETIRQVLAKAKLWERRRKAPKHHQKRPRRDREGEMLQVDASFHRWFGEEEPFFALVGAVDDATGKVVGAEFWEAETTEAYMSVFLDILCRHGIPESIYSDHDSVFFVNSPKERESILDSGRRMETQFGRAMRELGVRMIPASSPQAKGRIERLWGTFQDRLLHEMRLEGIKTPEAGNRYLRKFRPQYNQQFAVPAAKSPDAWRPSPGPARLAAAFCRKETRVLGNDHTFSHESNLWQVLPTVGVAALARRKIEVRVTLKGQVQAWHVDKRLKLASAPKSLRLLRPGKPHTPLAAMENAAAAYTRRGKMHL